MKTAPDTKVRTSHLYQLVPVGQKLLVRHHHWEVYKLTEYKCRKSTKFINITECKCSKTTKSFLFPFVIFAFEVIATRLIYFQMILFQVLLYQMEVTCLPVLVTPVRTRGAGGL